MNRHLQNYQRHAAYRFPNHEGMATNGYALAGAASILVEVTNVAVQKKIGMIKRHAFEQMWSILSATADESLYSVDSSRSDEIFTFGSYYHPKILPPHFE